MTADGQKIPSTLSFILNVVVVTKQATKPHVFGGILNQTAAIVIVVWDPELLRAKPLLAELKEGVEEAVNLNNITDKPYWQIFDLYADGGMVLVRPLHIAETTSTTPVFGATHVVHLLQFRCRSPI